MVAALGGPTDLLERPEAYLPVAPVQLPVVSPQTGFIDAMDVRALGNAIVELGGGRKVTDQLLDPAVGLSGIVDRGQRVEQGQTLATVHARTAADAARVEDIVRRAFTIAPQVSAAGLPLYEWTGAPA
jgi:thymidine phosphorylase